MFRGAGDKSTEPVVLHVEAGVIVTDRPISDGPVIVYVEDFPSLCLQDGDRLKVTGAGWTADGVARHRPERR